MAVRILHGADFHMDSPFEQLPGEKAAIRRREQREFLSRLTQYVNDNGTQIVLLSGDLLDSAMSYYETIDALISAFREMKAMVFISPGNHDYYTVRSPYASAVFSENVHIFRSTVIECVELAELGVRVWGCGFNSPQSEPLLSGFKSPGSDMTDIMVMHGEVGQGIYNPISLQDIEASGLDYLALGHVHTFSGIKNAGGTTYAYPGCPEGRGFDETGIKGVISGTVDKGNCSLRFVPMCDRQYKIVNISIDGQDSISEAIRSKISDSALNDIVRIVLTGEFDGDIDVQAVEREIEDMFFHVNVRDKTVPRRSIWDGMESDTLKGLFLSGMREKYDAVSDDERDKIIKAVRYGLAALENREEQVI